jgi:hypothetical protein
MPTRYLNFCRPEKPKPETKPHYRRYIDSYRWYEAGRVEYRQQYNEAYRELKDEEFHCECGCIVKQLSKYAHFRSKRHAQNLAVK